MTCHFEAENKQHNGGGKMNIKTIQVEQFRTSDGQTFADKADAIRHQVGLDIAGDIERYRTTGMDGASERFKNSVCKHIAAFECMRATATKEGTE